MENGELACARQFSILHSQFSLCWRKPPPPHSAAPSFRAERGITARRGAALCSTTRRNSAQVGAIRRSQSLPLLLSYGRNGGRFLDCARSCLACSARNDDGKAGGSSTAHARASRAPLGMTEKKGGGENSRYAGRCPALLISPFQGLALVEMRCVGGSYHFYRAIHS
jgi:hypothetical protein